MSHALKNMRSCLLSALVAAAIGLLSGCATTGDEADTSAKDPTGIEARQPSPTEDMNFIEKTGYYVGWLSLFVLYEWAGGNPSFPP